MQHTREIFPASLITAAAQIVKRRNGRSMVVCALAFSLLAKSRQEKK